MRKISCVLLTTALMIATPMASVQAQTREEALAGVVASRSVEDKARDSARHPVQTLDFFKIEPGMTVAEALPGGGWYTNILANYLGKDGAIYGVNYVDKMWGRFSFATEEWTAGRIADSGKFPAKVTEFTNSGIKAKGFTFNTVPPKVVGTVDRVLMIRALHNLNRFESQAGTRSQALSAVRGMLDSNGLVGVVQHRAPESATDEWADGSHGYLKQSAVIAMFEQAGFHLIARSEINANPKDQPGAQDSVWRLPPSLQTSEEKPELRAAMMAIGESDRMTLLFSKAP